LETVLETLAHRRFRREVFSYAYVARRVFREANRQIDERQQRRRAAHRLAAGLPPFDPSVPPESLDQLVDYLNETN
jgi:hypothetical protein